MRRSASPACRPRTDLASTSALSRTSGNACGLPTSACETDLASRCDCISDWPVTPTCWATLIGLTQARRTSPPPAPPGRSPATSPGSAGAATVVRLPRTGRLSRSPDSSVGNPESSSATSLLSPKPPRSSSIRQERVGAVHAEVGRRRHACRHPANDRDRRAAS